MKREELYEPPQMEVLELHTEGVLCASTQELPNLEWD